MTQEIVARSKADEDTARILSRARELEAGAPLKFGPEQMRKALLALLNMHRMARLHGETSTYISFNGVHAVGGIPHCQRCDKSFSSAQAYARHMMGYKHLARDTTREHIDEARAHLQAFPMTVAMFRERNIDATVHAYELKNLPTDAQRVDAHEPAQSADGPWHAYLEDDEENNSCVYLQRGEDRTGRELYEMVEFDVREGLPGQDTDYLRAAEAEARDRNRAESEER